MKNVILTGATSMLGIRLINECIRNKVNVYAIVRNKSLRKNRIPKSNLVHIIECDFENLDTYRFEDIKYDCFYHFAWQGTSSFDRDRNEIQSINISYAKAAIKLAIRLKCLKFIGIGSQAEYGRKNHIIKPSESTNPETEYGITKLKAYNLTKEYAKENNIKHIWCRIFSVYGSLDKDDTLVSTVIRKLKNNEKIELTKCEQLWDFLYDEDAGEALFLIGQKGKHDKIYNIASGVCKPLKEYVDTIKNSVNINADIEYGKIRYSKNQVMYLCGDIADTTKDTGWTPSTSFKEGIKKIVKS